MQALSGEREGEPIGQPKPQLKNNCDPFAEDNCQEREPEHFLVLVPFSRRFVLFFIHGIPALGTLEVYCMPNASIDPKAQQGLLRIKQVLELVPIGRSTWWAGVRSGKYPRPIKLSDRTTAWYRADIEELIASAGKAEIAPWVIRRKIRSPAGAPAEPASQGE